MKIEDNVEERQYLTDEEKLEQYEQIKRKEHRKYVILFIGVIFLGILWVIFYLF